jgi:prolyl 4-hydroxylase
LGLFWDGQGRGDDGSDLHFIFYIPYCSLNITSSPCPSRRNQHSPSTPYYPNTSSEPLFTPSTIWTGNREFLDTTIRHSEKAPLPRDHTVQCIESRARAFQGWRPYVFIEKLWSQRYATGGHYTYHYDWSTATRSSGRVSSFMVYLQANCTGGGTHFPRLAHPAPKNAKSEWCQFIECDGGDEYEGEDEGLKQGVIFKPIQGNAVYWENMRSDGSGYAESWHAGLPVRSGVKIGLNIWSWFQEGYVPEERSGSEIVEGK